MRLPYVLVPRDAYEQLLKQNARMIRTIVKMKVHGSFIPRMPMRVGERKADPRDALLQAIDDNPHAKAKPMIRKALVRHMDDQLRKGRTSPEELADLADTLRNWHKKPADADDDENDGRAINLADEIPLSFDETNPREQTLKANLTRGR
jgi:hypothetical protein